MFEVKREKLQFEFSQPFQSVGPGLGMVDGCLQLREANNEERCARW